MKTLRANLSPRELLQMRKRSEELNSQYRSQGLPPNEARQKACQTLNAELQMRK